MSLTPSQRTAYLAHIRCPPSADDADPLALLTRLQAGHIARVPFESISLHYSPHRRLSIDVDALFDKVVVRGMGGYCMELNSLFGALLRSLGLTVVSCGGRVNEPSGWTGWSHMVNIVAVGPQRYLVDVGFGSHEATRPVPLIPDETFTQIHPRIGRLEHRSISIHTDPNQRLWVYSTRDDDAAPWVEQYCFADVEFFPADYAVMNLHTMTSPTSLFVQSVLAARAILDDDDGVTVKGMYTLFGDRLKRSIGTTSEVIETFSSEETRVAALKKYFLIDLNQREQRSIKGLASELKDKVQP